MTSSWAEERVSPEAQARALKKYDMKKYDKHEPWRRQFCGRCGQLYDHCLHLNCSTTLDPEHALRIRGRYAIGKQFNVDHDTADYSDAGPC